MAKIQFFCDNLANEKSKRSSEILDTEKDLGFKPNEWEEMDEDGRYDLVYAWADSFLQIWYEEI